ncbi:MAG: universal stress protein [Betaproteobacteria bacterium]|nr:universal stress protein [Betaproteobacteria bacterium]
MNSPAAWSLLLATEHSEFDTGAERVAFALARRQGVALPVVLPVLSNPEFEAVAPQLAAKSDAEAARRRQALLVAAADLALEVGVRRGAEPYLEIIEEARQRDAELLVIRRRGKRGLLANLLVGEMVSKVVAHAPCDLLIVPREARMWSRGVLAGLDPRAPDTSLVDCAARVASTFGLPLTLVCVAESPAEAAAAQAVLDAGLARARGHGLAASGETPRGRAHEALLEATRRAGADLLMLGRHGGGLARAWIGGTAQKTIGLVECPVWIHLGDQG